MRAPTILALTLLLLAGTAITPQPAAAQSGIQVHLATLNANYGGEGWKDVNATLGERLVTSPVPTLPADATGTYSNPYHDPARPHQGPGVNWLGYKLTAKVELRDTNGDPAGGTSNYIVDAVVHTASGDVPVKLTKHSPSQFRLEVDLDGENGKGFPALTQGGRAELDVKVYRVPEGPAANPQFVGSRTFPLDTHRGSATPTGTAFPEAHLPGYDDASATNLTPLHLQPVRPDSPLTATFRFPGAANEPASVLLFHGTTRTVVHTGNTDANGTLQVTLTPGEGLATGSDTGLLLLEAHLTGKNKAMGSATVTFVATPHRPTFSSMQVEERDTEQLSTVQVTVKDPNPNPQNSSRHGELLLLQGADVFHSTRFDPTSFSRGEHRSARYPASAVTDPGYTRYDLFAFLFDGSNDVYGFSTATRGLRVTPLPTQVEPLERGALQVRVENLNDNGDAQIDSGLLSTVRVQVKGLPGTTGPLTDQVVVPENGVKLLTFPFTADDTGSRTVTVNATSGELHQDLTTRVDVTEPQGTLRSLDDLRRAVPAPGPALLLAAFLLATLTAALRRRN